MEFAVGDLVERLDGGYRTGTVEDIGENDWVTVRLTDQSLECSPASALRKIKVPTKEESLKWASLWNLSDGN